MQGPGLKLGLNLPYLGVTHWHSPSEYVFLSSPALTHTLPSNHKLHTSLRLHPHSHLPQYLKQVPSENTRPLIPPLLSSPLGVSHLLVHTDTFTGSELWVQAFVGGVDVTEVRQRKTINHLSPTPLMRFQTYFPTLDKSSCRMSRTYFMRLDSLLASVWAAEV